MADEEFDARTYLVVDDFSDMRSVMRSLLRSLSVSRIDLAKDGAEAISHMERKRYDVVLCDYNLGSGKDGQQVLEEARHRMLIGIDSIFVMVTAETARDMVMAAVEVSPDCYLTKPFTLELLKTRLHRLFERKANLAPVNQALVAKDFPGAIHALDRLLRAGPPNVAELLKLKAEICVMANRLDDAMTIYEEVLAERDLPWARMGIGKLLFLKKQYSQAEEVFKNLLLMDRNLIAAYDYLAKVQMAQREFAQAEKTLMTAAKLSPRALKRQQQLGDLALSNGNTEVAEMAFEKAVSLAQHSVFKHPALYAGLAKSMTANNKHDKALDIVRDIGRTFPNHNESAFYQATASAIALKNKGDLRAAAEAMQSAQLAMGQMSGAAASKLGLEMAKTYSALGEKGKAAKLLQTAIANNHDDEEFLTEVLKASRSAGIDDEEGGLSIREIQREIVKTNNEGVRLIRQGEFDDAIELLRKAAEEMPGNKTINLNAAKASIMKMEKHGATPEEIQLVRRYIERVQSADPGDWRLADVLTHFQKLALGI